MQKYSDRFNPEELTVVRKWRLWTVAFYGSIVAVLLTLGAISEQPTQVAGHQGPSAAAKTVASR